MGWNIAKASFSTPWHQRVRRASLKALQTSDAFAIGVAITLALFTSTAGGTNRMTKILQSVCLAHLSGSFTFKYELLCKLYIILRDTHKAAVVCKGINIDTN